MAYYDDFEEERRLTTKEVSSNADKAAQELAAEGRILHRVCSKGKKIASSFWGFEWCRSVTSYGDYESRIPMGRSLMRAGGVIDVQIGKGRIDALVVDRSVHTVKIIIDPPEDSVLDAVRRACAGKIESLAAFIKGELSPEVTACLCDPENGIFPRQGELKSVCDCLDDSLFCAHAAAALYAAGVLLDDEPELFFTMRGIEAKDFFSVNADASVLAGGAPDEADEVVPEDDLSAIFGMDVEK